MKRKIINSYDKFYKFSLKIHKDYKFFIPLDIFFSILSIFFPVLDKTNISSYFLTYLKEKSKYTQRRFKKHPESVFNLYKIKFYFYIIQKMNRLSANFNLQMKYLTFFFDCRNVTTRNINILSSFNVLVSNETLKSFNQELLKKIDFESILSDSIGWFDNYVKIHFKKFSTKLQNIVLSNKVNKYFLFL